MDKEHWEKIYATKTEQELSWFQDYPEQAMKLIESCNLPLAAKIIDVGGGDSKLVDALLEKGFQNIYVLDISVKALERSKKRLGESASKVHWIVSDVTEFTPEGKFDLWHDRATLHFLTDVEDIEKYVAAMNSIVIGGYAILGLFSVDGPDRCSGLKITQYSEESISERFSSSFELVTSFRYDHTTPSKVIQNFIYCLLQRKA